MTSTAPCDRESTARLALNPAAVTMVRRRSTTLPVDHVLSRRRGRRATVKVHAGSIFVTEFNKASDTAGSIKFYKDFDVVDLVVSHADEYVRLAKGTYYLADAATPKLKLAQVSTLAVSGKKADATAPPSMLVRTAANGHVAGSVTLAKGGYAHVVNKTAKPHITTIASIRSSTTSHQIHQFIADPAHRGASGLLGSYFALLGLIAGHTDIYKRIGAGAGRYFLFAASLTHPGLAKGQVGLLTVK